MEKNGRLKENSLLFPLLPISQPMTTGYPVEMKIKKPVKGSANQRDRQ
jgi:hypothetical protein